MTAAQIPFDLPSGFMIWCVIGFLGGLFVLLMSRPKTLKNWACGLAGVIAGAPLAPALGLAFAFFGILAWCSDWSLKKPREGLKFKYVVYRTQLVRSLRQEQRKRVNCHMPPASFAERQAYRNVIMRRGSGWRCIYGLFANWMDDASKNFRNGDFAERYWAAKQRAKAAGRLKSPTTRHWIVLALLFWVGLLTLLPVLVLLAFTGSDR